MNKSNPGSPEALRSAIKSVKTLTQADLNALRLLESETWAALNLNPEAAETISTLFLPPGLVPYSRNPGPDNVAFGWTPGNRVSRTEEIEVLGMALCLKAHQLAAAGQGDAALAALTSSMYLSCLVGLDSPSCFLRGYRLCRTAALHLQTLSLRYSTVREAAPDLSVLLPAVEARIPSAEDLIRREATTTIEHVEWTLDATDGMFPSTGATGPVLAESPILHRFLVSPEKDTRRNLNWLFETFILVARGSDWNAWALETVRQRILGSNGSDFWCYKDPLGRFFARDMIDPLLDVVITERSWHALLRCLAVWEAVQRYVTKRGTLPASAEALVPDFLSSLPSDPFCSASTAFSRSPSGTWTVYSVGADGVDNGGTAGAWFEESPDDYSDLVLSDPTP